MLRILAILLFFLLLFTFVRGRKMDVLSKRVMYCFLGIWSVSVIVSIWNPIELNEVGLYTYILILISILTCVLGFCSFKISRKKQSKLDFDKLDDNINHVVHNPFFVLLLVGAVLYTTWIMIQNYQVIILSQSLSEVRDMYFEDVEKLYGYGFVTIRDIFLNPLSIICAPLFAYLFFKKRDNISILMGLFLIEHASIGGGRVGYARILIIFIFVIYCLLYKEPSKKKVRIIGIVAAVFGFVIFAATMMRSGNVDMSAKSMNDSSEETLSQIVVYVAGPIVALDYAIEDDYVSKMGGYSYGVCTFCSVDRLLQPIIKFFDPSRLPASNRFIGYKQENMISISPKIASYNALYTANLFYYLDFGFFGVILFPFFFGYLFRYLLSLLYIKNNVAILSLAAWIFGKFMTSNMDFYFISHLDIIIVVVFLLWGNFLVHSWKGSAIKLK